MALNLSTTCCFYGLREQRRRKKIERGGVIRAVASEEFTSLKAEEEKDKVKLGGSDLKVTRLGIGAWSWGDTSYWNNFDWDGNYY